MTPDLMKHALVIAALAALTACNEKPKADASPSPAPPAAASASPDQQAQAGPEAKTGQIDWEAARKAKAEASRGDQTVSVAAAPGGPPPAVPMLLPAGVVRAANAGPPAIRKTETGYFANYDMPKYSATVTGTNKSYVTGAPSAGAKEALKFTIGEGEATMSFSRFGADYTIQFECKQIDGGDTCITEAEAKEFADSLFVAQTQ
jgi:predicted small lipoprotein YifL